MAFTDSQMTVSVWCVVCGVWCVCREGGGRGRGREEERKRAGEGKEWMEERVAGLEWSREREGVEGGRESLKVAQ